MKKDRAAFAVHQLKEQGLTLATCESLTGGMLGEAVTAVPGASAVYRGGFITYTNEMKHELAAVPEEVLSRKGAVSKKCAAAMAEGAAAVTHADIAVSTTGNAGPEPSEGKPVGLVYIGIRAFGNTRVKKCSFEGSRASIRKQTVETALKMLCRELKRNCFEKID
ncbi:MAG: CinA family protein [Lachnospiraceae bacterium]|nr:CinA family protein [Lachnospiraceae bacterium]